MLVVETPGVFRGIPVGQAMRRQVVSLPSTANVAQGIRMMIRYKVNAVLLTDNGIPHGVVSKTDLLGAYYAELPTETALGDVMGSQPMACFPDDLVEDALEIMEAAGKHAMGWLLITTPSAVSVGSSAKKAPSRSVLDTTP